MSIKCKHDTNILLTIIGSVYITLYVEEVPLSFVKLLGLQCSNKVSQFKTCSNNDVMCTILCGTVCVNIFICYWNYNRAY